MITVEEFAQRRQAVIEQMSANSIAVVAAAREVTRSRDTEYAFRQDSDFYYLTGFNEPEAWLILSNSDEHPQHILFCRDKDAEAEVWQGRRLGPEQAESQLGIEFCLSINELDEQLLVLLNNKQRLLFAQGQDSQADQRIFAMLADLRNAPKQTRNAPPLIEDIRPLLHEMRLFKSAAEAELMQQAAEISGRAHIRAMNYCRPGVFEYQLEAEIQHEFAMSGARHPAYSTIVGGGDNGCILHYTENNDELADGELVLIDAGAEYQGYAADITRTFPVNGRFSEPQKALYELVLKAQSAAFDMIRPGNTLAQASDQVVEIITRGLIDLGILQGELRQNIEDKSYRQYFMHGLGHWLGLDVHDVGDYKIAQQDRPFKPGMVLTIEPGIYIAKDSPVAEQWQGIGIRIEDNLLVTDDGYQNLTASVPKTVAELEALMTCRGAMK
ncbi:Xaa-Pro aminopeptidase [Neptunicella sp. SCSIO 80796]|uniref:Xaa-Pro aminopeptidase n=1 Tax=Neptunicella plasticusilytica TaxID=3117012 RepID=UPI003A4D9E3F